MSCPDGLDATGDFEGLAGCFLFLSGSKSHQDWRALGGGTGWLHPVSCQSEHPSECMSRTDGLDATGDFEGLACCVCTCRVQKVTKTGGRWVAALAGFIQ